MADQATSQVAPAAQSSNPRVRRNDWSALPAPPVEPTLSVSVVMPAYGRQHTLDLALAALSAQTYPERLLEVVVVDDNSSPPLRLPDVRPANTRLIRSPDTGWGRAHACHAGALIAEGDLIHWLDSDMVAFTGEVAAHAGWHEKCDYAFTIGYKRFVDPASAAWELTPESVVAAVKDGSVSSAFNRWSSHDWVEEIIDRSAMLREGDHECFRAAVGATGALRRDFYREIGGLDTALRLGEDSEIGYRMAQGGAVFVPVPDAMSWHLGHSTAMRDAEQVKRYNSPFVTDRMPLPRYRRRAPHRTWTIPLVEVVVSAEAVLYEHAAASVDTLLASTVSDLRVTLVAPWDALKGDHRPAIADPSLNLRLLREHVRGEARARLISIPDVDVFPVAYRLDLAPDVAVRPSAVGAIIAYADEKQLGLLALSINGRPVGRLTRTAALRRARRVSEPGENLSDVVAQVWGSGVLDIGVAELAVDQQAADQAAIKALGQAAADADRWREEAGRLRQEALTWRREALRRGYGRPAWRWIPAFVLRQGRSSGATRE